MFAPNIVYFSSIAIELLLQVGQRKVCGFFFLSRSNYFAHDGQHALTPALAMYINCMHIFVILKINYKPTTSMRKSHWKKCFNTAFEPPHDKTNKMVCAPSEDSDQPGHPPSLIRVFAVRMKKAWVLSNPLSAQRILWSESSVGAHCWF